MLGTESLAFEFSNILKHDYLSGMSSWHWPMNCINCQGFMITAMIAIRRDLASFLRSIRCHFNLKHLIGEQAGCTYKYSDLWHWPVHGVGCQGLKARAVGTQTINNAKKTVLNNK